MIGRQSSRHFWSVVWRHNRIAILILSLLSVISLVFATRWINAQEPVPTLALREAAIEPKLKQDSKSAWDDLQQSAQSRLSSANDQTATARAIMDDLLDFRVYRKMERSSTSVVGRSHEEGRMVKISIWLVLWLYSKLFPCSFIVEAELRIG